MNLNELAVYIPNGISFCSKQLYPLVMYRTINIEPGSEGQTGIMTW